MVYMRFFTAKLLPSVAITLCTLTAQANTIEQHWEVAKSLYESREYSQAGDAVAKLLAEHPQHWDARPIGAWFYWEASKRANGSDRTNLEKKAEAMILEGLRTPELTTSWVYQREIGDFYRLRQASNVKAYPYYKNSVEHFASASPIQQASLLDRLARSAEELGRKGEAVKASCQALELDPSDHMAKNRLKKLAGNCERKGIHVKTEDGSEAHPKDPKPDAAKSH